jgi:hypothetical protein
MTTTYQGASSAHFHPTRRTPRALRQGDRVRDRFHARYFPEHVSNYPGAHAFGTVIQGPTFRGSTLLVNVRFDDGFDAWLLPADLERL